IAVLVTVKTLAVSDHVEFDIGRGRLLTPKPVVQESDLTLGAEIEMLDAASNGNRVMHQPAGGCTIDRAARTLISSNLTRRARDRGPVNQSTVESRRADAGDRRRRIFTGPVGHRRDPLSVKVDGHVVALL
ncbi:hypothetical protein, partial [Mycobacterium sp. E1386]|uniref:hypothetical protein n=1 Tax=Mycobacterium sp. E1386 TaxID=1834126 RepID=UPI001E44EF77